MTDSIRPTATTELKWSAAVDRARKANSRALLTALLEDGPSEGVDYDSLCAEPSAESRAQETPQRLIGQLLDAWEGTHNDFKSELLDEYPSLHNSLQAIYRAVESGEFWVRELG